MYKKILLATDGSEHSIRAAEYAAGLAKNQEDCTIYVVYVVDGETSKADVLRSWTLEGVVEKRRHKIRTTMEKAKTEGIQYEMVILRGEPGPTIVKYANENAFDLVVIGSRGLNTLQELVLGSVSHKVAKRAKCPVMIIK